MHESSQQVSEQQLDRLADGELSLSERRELLLALEQTPDGWRRCAMTFLELQSLNSHLPNLLADSTEESEPNKVVPRREVSTQSGRWRDSHTPWWSLAAVVLLAFGIGYGVSKLPGLNDERQIVNLPSVEPQPVDPALQPRLPVAGGAQESLVVWSPDQKGGRREIKAPLMDAEAIRKRFGVKVQVKVGPSPEMLRRFEEQGFRIKTNRRFVPLFIGGQDGVGRPLVVPVDDVQVVPVDNVSL